ncbi:YdbH domain-containing protein [Thalassolituus sp. LLYu03]|uniref:YdbH domain-containing protein n=1 Tax=Thalassolituus sp. LLYu03 TaxID=3421656 RepID=UPI003D2D3609
MVFSKGLLRRAGLIAGLSLIISGGVIAALPSLLKPALNRWLPDVLADDGSARVLISHFSWTRLTLDELTLPLADGTLIRLHALDLHFRPGELLQGRIRSLLLDEISVSMPADTAGKVAVAAASNAAANARAGFNQPVEIPAFAQWLTLPADAVTVKRLLFQHPAFSAELSAELTPALWRVHGDVHLDNQPLPWQAELQLQQSGDWLLMLAEQQSLLMQVYGHIAQDEHDTRITLDQRVGLAALTARLPALAALADQPLRDLLVKADIRLPNQGVLPRDAVLGAVTTLSTQPKAMAGGAHWHSGAWLLSLTKATADAAWQFRLDGQPQRVSVDDQLLGFPLTVVSSQQLTGSCNAELSQCEAEGELLNAVSSAQTALASFSVKPALSWQLDSAISLVLPTDLTTTADASALFGLPLQDSHISGELIALSDPNGDWQISSIPGFSAEFGVSPQMGWTIPRVSALLLPQLYVHGNLNASRADERLSIDPLTLELKPLTLTTAGTRETPGSHLHLADNRISCLPQNLTSGVRAQCELALSLNKSGFDGWPVPDAHLTGPLTLVLDEQTGEQSLIADLSLKAALNQAKLRLQLQQDLASGTGSLQWHLNDMPLNWSSLNLPEMTGLTGVEVLGGGISGQGWVDWQPGEQGLSVTPDVMLRADNLSAVYDSTVAMDGWNALIAVRRPFNGDYLIDAQVSGNSLNPGIELKDILARSQTRIPADFSYALAEIQEVHTDVLGGRVHMPLIRFDTRKDINAFGIELEHIQLAQIAALEANAEVQATGTLDGVLPIVISSAGPSVPGGALFARSPGGVIRYKNATSDALGQSDQTVGLAMQLLENFQYEQLQSNIQYQPDGQLNLGLQFQGKNPDFFGGQKTHLNVNLEYNLLDLLESLRVTQDVVSKLENKYQ